MQVELCGRRFETEATRVPGASNEKDGSTQKENTEEKEPQSNIQGEETVPRDEGLASEGGPTSTSAKKYLHPWWSGYRIKRRGRLLLEGGVGN